MKPLLYSLLTSALLIPSVCLADKPERSRTGNSTVTQIAAFSDYVGNDGIYRIVDHEHKNVIYLLRSRDQSTPDQMEVIPFALTNNDAGRVK